MESAIYPNVVPIQNKQLSFVNSPAGVGGGATLNLDQYSTYPKIIILSVVSIGWGSDQNKRMYINAIVPIPHNGEEETAAVVAGQIIGNGGTEQNQFFSIIYNDQENTLRICLNNPQVPQSFVNVIANAVIIE